MTRADSSLALTPMIRFLPMTMLLLITSVWGVDAAHGWSHVELSDQHQHSHDDACELCEWDVVVVPEPVDLQLIPEFTTWPVRLNPATIGDEAGMESVHADLWPSRGPPAVAET